MSGLFSLLFMASFFSMIVGLVRPKIFDRFFKGSATRKKAFFVFGVSSFLCLLMIGVTSPESSKNKDGLVKEENTAVQNVEKDKTENQKNEPAPAPTPKTIEEKIADAINKELGQKTNMKKQRVVSVEIEKYSSKLLSDYGYKSDDSIVGVFVKINSDENMTSNLQKGTMHKEFSEIVKSVFPIDKTIGDILVYSQLPVKDKYGNIKDDTAIVYSMSRSLFDKINWVNINHRELPDLLKLENETDDRNSYFESIKF